MHRALLAALAALICLVAAGCGSGEEETPAACLHGPSSYEAALRHAPGTVLLTTDQPASPISGCLTKNQSAGDIAAVGTSMIGAATELNAKVRANLPGASAVQVGYLVGAATRGASDTGGIHANLIERLTTAARFNSPSQPLPANFDRAYDKGYAAGRSHG